MSEWAHKAAAWLGNTHRKVLAVGALERREGPGTAKRDPRRGKFRLLFATTCFFSFSLFFFLTRLTITLRSGKFGELLISSKSQVDQKIEGL